NNRTNIISLFFYFFFSQFQRWRRFVFRIPQQYVNDGDKAVQVFDLGTWNLQFKFMVISTFDFTMYTIALPILLALISSANGFIKLDQSVEIHGRFMCGQQPLHRVAIELWEDERSLLKSIAYILLQKRGPNDVYLARTNTNEHGEFKINGTYQVPFIAYKIKPYIYVYHRCDADELPISKSRSAFKLWRTFVIKVPEKYINIGNRALQTFDLGVYNLQFQFVVKFSFLLPVI
uniref:Transthyretin-like family protein n=1 Tax=Elaeophora elaphi TaxID=1147741 RepID=A0A0R3S350_9BILA